MDSGRSSKMSANGLQERECKTQKDCLSVRNKVGEFFSLSVTQPLAVRFDKRVWFTHIFLVTLKHFVCKSSVSVSRTADEALRSYACYKG